MIDAAIEGTLNTKMPKVAMDLFKEMTMNSYKWHSSKAKSNKPTHVYDVNAITTLAMQVETLSKKIDRLTITKQQALFMHYDLYGRGHES